MILRDKAIVRDKADAEILTCNGQKESRKASMAETVDEYANCLVWMSKVYSLVLEES